MVAVIYYWGSQIEINGCVVFDTNEKMEKAKPKKKTKQNMNSFDWCLTVFIVIIMKTHWISETNAPQTSNLTKSSECVSVLNKLSGIFFFAHKCYCTSSRNRIYTIWLNELLPIYNWLYILFVCPVFFLLLLLFVSLFHIVYLYFSQSVLCFLFPASFSINSNSHWITAAANA